MMLLGVPVKLFPLNVLEHIPVLGEVHVVREHLRVLLIEANDLWQPCHCFILSVPPLQELRNVIEDQIVLEHGDNVGGFIIDDVVDDFSVVILLGGQIFGL